MLTCAGNANHLTSKSSATVTPYLIRPERISPRTPTETLQQILAPDEAPTSATTDPRELNDQLPGFSG